MIVYLIFYNNVEFNDSYYGGEVFSTKEKAEEYFLDKELGIWHTGEQPYGGVYIEAEIVEREVL